MKPRLPRYDETRPGPALIPYVQCYWTITASAAPSLLNRVCPDGCADVIIDLGAIRTGSGLDDGRCTYAVGTMQRASRVEVVGNVHLLGVRFRPGAAERFFRLPMHELTDQIIPLFDLWSGAGALERSVQDAQSDAARIRQLEEALLRSSREPAATLRGAIGFIGHTGGPDRSESWSRQWASEGATWSANSVTGWACLRSCSPVWSGFGARSP